MPVMLLSIHFASEMMREINVVSFSGNREGSQTARNLICSTKIPVRAIQICLPYHTPRDQYTYAPAHGQGLIYTTHWQVEA